uniref:Uncharacterized protein n=1 Tax=Moniliophthora roreri TaxID=221103 RepID=A0A0W0F5C3_MONRR
MLSKFVAANITALQMLKHTQYHLNALPVYTGY